MIRWWCAVSLVFKRLCQVKFLGKREHEVPVSTRNLFPVSGSGRKKSFGVRAGCHWDGHLFIEVVVGRLGFLLVGFLLVGLSLVGVLLAIFYTTVDVLC